MSLEVAKGVEGANPSPLPLEFVNLKTIRNGATVAFFPLYHVTLNGVTIEKIEPVFVFAQNKKVLFTGPVQMDGSAEIELSEQVSRQKTGIVLIWSPYGTDVRENLHYQYIPKESISLFGETTHSIFLCNTNMTKVGCKSVTVGDDYIKGSQYNMSEGQHNGIIFNNADYTLRYVLGY